MTFLLLFLLSWLSGLLIIYLFAFLVYESFSIVDITSFAIFTFAGSVILIPIFYLVIVNWLNKKITGNKQLLYFPVALLLLANLPAYITIWYATNNWFGLSEALLFHLGFATTAIVFGVAWAWKNHILNVKKVE